MIQIFTEIVGYTAAVVGTLLMLPQIAKSWKTKKVDDLSFGMVILYFVNCFLWLVYGILIVKFPVILANGVAIVIATAQIFLKFKYTSS